MIAEILALAARLPAGLPDPAALFKLHREEEELLTAIADHDHTGALTEIADMAYYAIKVIHLAASWLDLDVDTALQLAVAKYALRARPGNPKDDGAERAACLAVLQEAN